MCGIAGYAGLDRTEAEQRADLEAMCDAIVHRGPDDAGYFVAPGVALGMRRLSIIDVAGGHQPIGNEDASVHIVFNGEVYNYRELHSRLERCGHRFGTRSDTETVVHQYEESGDRVVDVLRGMFAFAIWDSRRQRLLLARDRLGIKPLYYWATASGVAFASELKSLRSLDFVPVDVDRAAIADYLALGYVPEPACIYQGVRKLRPGHILIWERGRGVEIKRYWSPLRSEDPTIDERTAVEEIRRLLAEAVRYRLIAEVPLGAFLSGGLDSSAVVAEMARQMDRPVQTFSIGFEEPEFNEAPHAALVAEALGTDHTELVVRPDADALIETIAGQFDEPFADSSAIPTFLVSQLARTRVTVALSGDGGDELFGGYTRYQDLQRRNIAIPRQARAVLRTLALALPQSARGRNRLLELSRGLHGRYAGMVADSLPPAEGGVAGPDLLLAGKDMDRLLRHWFEEVPARDIPTRASFVDLMSYLPGDILTKVDRMSMAVSLEARVPLLDHHLVEFAASLPDRFRLRDGVGKWIWREAIRGLVPAAVFHRPKQGFGVPLRHWFKHELRHRLDALASPASSIQAYVDERALHRVIAEHRSGRRDHSAMLWKLLVLHLWLTAG